MSELPWQEIILALALVWAVYIVYRKLFTRSGGCGCGSTGCSTGDSLGGSGKAGAGPGCSSRGGSCCCQQGIEPRPFHPKDGPES